MKLLTRLGIGGATLTTLGLIADRTLRVRRHVEGPRYSVDRKTGAFELRTYEARLVAETTVDGRFCPALNEGFRRLAGFIFGRNLAQTRVSMTSPVEGRSQKISMTAPVDAQRQKGRWLVRFTMPARWTKDTLPRPKDERIAVRTLPPSRLATVRFRGRVTPALGDRKERELRAWAKEEGLDTSGAATLAQYDPPWTPGFFRRNEVLLPVDVRH